MNGEMSGQHIFLTENLTATQQHRFYSYSIGSAPLVRPQGAKSIATYFPECIRLQNINAH
jgi:hypothetical protein